MPISNSDMNKGKAENVDSSFVFKPHANPVSVPCLLSVENQASASCSLLSAISLGDLFLLLVKLLIYLFFFWDLTKFEWHFFVQLGILEIFYYVSEALDFFKKITLYNISCFGLYLMKTTNCLIDCKILLIKCSTIAYC